VSRKHKHSGIITNSIILPPSVAALVARVFSSSDDDCETADGSASLGD